MEIQYECEGTVVQKFVCCGPYLENHHALSKNVDSTELNFVIVIKFVFSLFVLPF